MMFSLRALVTTHTDERLIANDANIGFSDQPRKGVNTPAASGIPMQL